MEDRFDVERRAWNYYGFAWTRIKEQIEKGKYHRKHELRVIERRKQKIVEWKAKLDKTNLLSYREARILEAEPFLDVTKQLQSIDEALPWVEMIREKAEAEKIDYKAAAAQIKQDLQYYQQLGGIERQIQKANQELGLINMTAIRKQQALRVVEGLLNRGISESQIINFSWQVQQPNNISPGSSNPGHSSSNVNISNGNGFSMQDWIRLFSQGRHIQHAE